MSQVAARLLVFFTSAAVLVIEILAQRLLAPYLGVSLEVFTGVIGVILAGIAVGAWAGGRAADRADPGGLLGPILVLGGISALAAPLIVDLVGPATPTSGPVSIVLLSSIGFFAPAAVLSAVPPVVVKLRLATLAETGTVVGSYSAVSTAGGLFGTFLTGFVLIAAFPTRPIVAAVGIALVVAGGVMWRRRGPTRFNAALAGAVLAGGLFLFDGPCQYETTYHCADVVVDPDRPGGRTLLLDRVSNSYVDLDDPTHLEFRYAKVMQDVIAATLPGGPLNVVSIGGGGFTFNGYLAAVRPGTSHITLEIDRPLVEIGHRHLGLAEDSDVIVDDARRSIDQIEEAWADLVIGDAFSGLSVPWHLTTEEFVEEIAERLAPGGIYTMNVIDYRDLDFVRSELATLREVFEHTAVVAPPSYLAAEAGGNFVLVASDTTLPIDGIESAIAARDGREVGLTDLDLTEFIDGAEKLTDDYAPVDQMIDRPGLR
ncbi:MAG TPA: fused MFS/spermidine synthase [Acidimicrobiia bacterium]|nr:fused MFS/spermidine synthase [Acidimicrobiia bacterium]